MGLLNRLERTLEPHREWRGLAEVLQVALGGWKKVWIRPLNSEGMYSGPDTEVGGRAGDGRGKE